jgi:hypothetical protein
MNLGLSKAHAYLKRRFTCFVVLNLFTYGILFVVVVVVGIYHLRMGNKRDIYVIMTESRRLRGSSFWSG